GPSATAGISMSLGPRRALAFRAALLGVLAAVTGVFAAVTFGVSLRHLVDTPREQGWNWDVFVGNPNAEQAFTGDPIAPSPQATAGAPSSRPPGGSVTPLAGPARAHPGTPALQFAVRYRSGVDHGAARRSLLKTFGREVLHPYPGGEVGNLARVDSLPY